MPSVDVEILKGGKPHAMARARPIRITPTGVAGVVYRRKVYAVRCGELGRLFLDVLDKCWSDDLTQCPIATSRRVPPFADILSVAATVDSSASMASEHSQSKVLDRGVQGACFGHRESRLGDRGNHRPSGVVDGDPVTDSSGEEESGLLNALKLARSPGWLLERVAAAINSGGLSVRTLEAALSRRGMVSHELEKLNALSDGGRSKFNTIIDSLAERSSTDQRACSMPIGVLGQESSGASQADRTNIGRSGLVEAMKSVGAPEWLVEAVHDAIKAGALTVSTVCEAAARRGHLGHELEKIRALGNGGRLRFNAYLDDVAAFPAGSVEAATSERVIDQQRRSTGIQDTRSDVAEPAMKRASVEGSLSPAVTSGRDLKVPEFVPSGRIVTGGAMPPTKSAIGRAPATLDYLDACLIPKTLQRRLIAIFEDELHLYRDLESVTADTTRFAKRLALVRGVGPTAIQTILRAVRDKARVAAYLRQLHGQGSGDSPCAGTDTDVQATETGRGSTWNDGDKANRNFDSSAMPLKTSAVALEAALAAKGASDSRQGLADDVRREAIRRRLAGGA